MALRDGIDRVHVRHLTIETDRHDGLGARCDLGLDQRGIDIGRVWIDIDKYRLST